MDVAIRIKLDYENGSALVTIVGREPSGRQYESPLATFYFPTRMPAPDLQEAAVARLANRLRVLLGDLT